MTEDLKSSLTLYRDMGSDALKTARPFPTFDVLTRHLTLEFRLEYGQGIIPM